PARALENHGTTLDSKERALAKADDGLLVLFEELLDALFLCFSHVSRGRIWVEVVGADLEVDQTQRLERARLHHGHVLRCLPAASPWFFEGWAAPQPRPAWSRYKACLRQLACAPPASLRTLEDS